MTPESNGRLPVLSLLAIVFWFALPAEAQKNSDIENIGRRDINKGSWNIYSWEREISLGQQLARELETTSAILADREVNAYLYEVAQLLVRNSDARVPFTVRIIDSEEVNAVALPGGYLYVNTGLVLATQSEAELAGILAHEIAHVAARHSVEQATKASLFNWLSLPLLFVGGSVAYAAHQVMSIAVPLTFLKFSRNAEREADFLGLQYSFKAGYDPVAMIDLLERLKADEAANVPGIFSTHPMTADRIKRAEKAIGSILPPRPEHVVTTSRFRRIQQRLLELRAAEALYALPGTRTPVLRRRTEQEE